MPLPTEALTRKSTDDEVRRAINNCIRQARREGEKPNVAAGMCYDSARKNAGERKFMRK